MKKFDFVEFFYDAVKDMTVEQKGQFITVLSEYYFNGKTKFADIDKTVIGAVNMAINYNRKQNPESKVDEWEKKKAQSKEVLDYIKENDLIVCVKTGLTEDQKQEIYDFLSHIPQEIIDSTINWVKTKYNENYYNN